jgi:hypothetical protein
MSRKLGDHLHAAASCVSTNSRSNRSMSVYRWPGEGVVEVRRFSHAPVRVKSITQFVSNSRRRRSKCLLPARDIRPFGVQIKRTDDSGDPCNPQWL